jgi:hypothetical protein
VAAGPQAKKIHCIYTAKNICYMKQQMNSSLSQCSENGFSLLSKKWNFGLEFNPVLQGMCSGKPVKWCVAENFIFCYPNFLKRHCFIIFKWLFN